MATFPVNANFASEAVKAASGPGGSYYTEKAVGSVVLPAGEDQLVVPWPLPGPPSTSALVLVTVQSIPDATALSFGVSLTIGTTAALSSFTIHSNAAATADVVLAFAIINS